MIYTGEFKNVDETFDYKITLETQTEGEDVEITCGGTPFVYNLEGSEDNLYEPVRYAGGTISLVTDYLFDLYAAEVKDVPVRVTRSKAGENSYSNVFVGYVTPSVYTQDFKYERGDLQIDVVDGLTVLKSLPYLQDRGVHSFMDILKYLFQQAGCYNYFYFPHTTKINDDIANTLEALKISTNNFYEEREDDNETEQDVAWKCSDVLEEICRWLNVTAVAYQGAVYMLDYDALIQGTTMEFERWNVYGGTPSTITVRMITPKVAVNADSFASDDNSVSMLPVYNKFTVSDDFNTLDSIFNGLFDYATNITGEQDDSINSYFKGTLEPNSIYRLGDSYPDDTDGQLLIRVLSGADYAGWANSKDYPYYPQAAKSKYKEFVFLRYMMPDSSIAIPYWYNNKTAVDYPTEMDYTTLCSYYNNGTQYGGQGGAMLFKADISKVETTPDYDEGDFSTTSELADIDLWLNVNVKSKVSWSEYIALFNPTCAYFTESEAVAHPYLDIIAQNNDVFIGGENTYLVISGNVLFHMFDAIPYPVTQGQIDINNGRYVLDDSDGNLLMSFCIGNNWYNGESWQDTFCTFKVPYTKKNIDVRWDEAMFQSNAIRNTVKFQMGLNESGYVIPCPTNAIMTGQPKLTIYPTPSAPYRQYYKHSGKSGGEINDQFRQTMVFIKGLTVKYVIGDPTWSDANDDDTVYVNQIQSDSVMDFEEQKFKVCTYDNKNPTYSAVGYEQDGVMNYVDNMTTVMGEQTMEECLVNRLYNQYSTPKKQLEFTVKRDTDSTLITPYSVIQDEYFGDTKFVTDSIEWDLKYNTAKCKFVEK